jgi:hypothetical protein
MNKMVYANGPIWVLTLNEYQRNNLLFLLNLCGYPWTEQDPGVEPFTIMNNGDWLGEIAIMLGKVTFDGYVPERKEWVTTETQSLQKGETANATRDHVKWQLDFWLKQQIEKADKRSAEAKEVAKVCECLSCKELRTK